MEKTHFCYTTEEKIPAVEANKEQGIEAQEERSIIAYHSFDVDRVIRVLTIEEDVMLVLLDDLHERWETRPKINLKTQKPKFDKQGGLITERVKDTFQSEIRLNKEQGLELLKLIAINYE